MKLLPWVHFNHRSFDGNSWHKSEIVWFNLFSSIAFNSNSIRFAITILVKIIQICWKWKNPLGIINHQNLLYWHWLTEMKTEPTIQQIGWHVFVLPIDFEGYPNCKQYRIFDENYQRHHQVLIVPNNHFPTKKLWFLSIQTKCYAAVQLWHTNFCFTCSNCSHSGSPFTINVVKNTLTVTMALQRTILDVSIFAVAKGWYLTTR